MQQRWRHVRCGRAAALVLSAVLLVVSASAGTLTTPSGSKEVNTRPASIKKEIKEEKEQVVQPISAPLGKKVSFQATRSATIKFAAAGNAMLGSYLTSEAALPKLMYAAKYERVNEAGRYRCEIDPIRFFSLHLVPMLDAQLDLDPHTRTASLLSISRGVRRARASETVSKTGSQVGFNHKGDVDHSSFQMYTTATTRWVPADEEGKMWALTTEQTLQVSMDKPGWILVPSAVVNRAGNVILGQVLKSATPDYLHRLRAGYVAWAEEVSTKRREQQAQQRFKVPQSVADMLNRFPKWSPNV